MWQCVCICARARGAARGSCSKQLSGRRSPARARPRPGEQWRGVPVDVDGLWSGAVSGDDGTV